MMPGCCGRARNTLYSNYNNCSASFDVTLPIDIPCALKRLWKHRLQCVGLAACVARLVPTAFMRLLLRCCCID